MISVGETLRRERVKRNFDLDYVSKELKIAPKLLEAIEEERFDSLPGGVFVKSFVRQYARLLDLDDEELVGEVRRILEPHTELAQTMHAVPPPDAAIPLPRMKGWQAVGDGSSRWSASLPSFAMVVIMLLVCSGVYTWWQRSRRPAPVHPSAPPGVAAVQTPQSPPPATPAETPAPAVSSPAEPAQTAAGNAPAPEEGERPGAESVAGANAAPPAPNAPPPASTPNGRTSAPRASNGQTSDSASPNGETAAAPNGASVGELGHTPEPNPNAAVRVEVTAQEPVWILVRTDGEYSFSGTLDANQTRIIAANQNVLLRVGNAGGVSISLNGKPIGPLGPKGQVRTLQLTPGGFHIVPPAAPKPASPVEALDPL